MRAVQRAHEQTALYQCNAVCLLSRLVYSHCPLLHLKPFVISFFKNNLKDNHVLCCSGDILSNFSVGLSLAIHRNWHTTGLEHTVAREGLESSKGHFLCI